MDLIPIFISIELSYLGQFYATLSFDLPECQLGRQARARQSRACIRLIAAARRAEVFQQCKAIWNANLQIFTWDPGYTLLPLHMYPFLVPGTCLFSDSSFPAKCAAVVWSPVTVTVQKRVRTRCPGAARSS